jgi:hypothetical protein
MTSTLAAARAPASSKTMYAPSRGPPPLISSGRTAWRTLVQELGRPHRFQGRQAPQLASSTADMHGNPAVSVLLHERHRRSASCRRPAVTYVVSRDDDRLLQTGSCHDSRSLALVSLLPLTSAKCNPYAACHACPLPCASPY